MVGILMVNSSMFHKALGYNQGRTATVASESKPLDYREFARIAKEKGYSDAAINKTIATHKLTTLGYSQPAIAGILGNAHVESAGTFDPSIQAESGEPAYGIFQFNHKKPYYDAWRGDKEDTVENQIQFMHETIYGDQQDVVGVGNAKKLQKIFEADDANYITKGFMDEYEKPHQDYQHLDRRLNYGKYYYNLLKGEK